VLRGVGEQAPQLDTAAGIDLVVAGALAGAVVGETLAEIAAVPLAPLLRPLDIQREALEDARQPPVEPLRARGVRFEVELRRFVRQAVVEEMTPDLKQKLSALRTPLL
jgi:hypothetical protein